MYTIEEIKERCCTADGFDDAIMGMTFDTLTDYPAAIYSIEKILSILIKNSNGEMSHEEAQEFFEFNIEGAYVSEQQPIYCHEVFP